MATKHYCDRCREEYQEKDLEHLEFSTAPSLVECSKKFAEFTLNKKGQ